MKSQKLSDSQKWITQNFLMNFREKIIKEKQSYEAIAKTLEKPLGGTLASKANIERCMKVVGMLKDYREATLGKIAACGIALAHARTSAVAAALKKLAKEIGVDVTAELRGHFDE